MKKTLFATLIASILVVGIFGTVAAQGPDPEYPGNGYGMHGAMMGAGLASSADGTTGPLHDSMMTVFADKLGLSVDAINASLAEGKTIYDLFTAAGLSAEDFSAAMTEARQAAFTSAVTNGAISQEQADWMSQRQQGQGGWGTCLDGTPDGQNQSFRRGGRWAAQQ